MPIISLFNHKGGVSKTTTAFHLGWMLTEKGYKVLLVDADSQCNLTSLFLGDKFEDYYEQNPSGNIKFALSPAFESKPELIKAFPGIQSPRNEKLFLIPGSFDLSEYEVPLGVSFSLSDTMLPLKNLPGSFYKLINETAISIEADYVIVDMNPSLSAINQVLLVSSNYFIVPTSPDIFSLMAIRSLAKVLPRWESWAKNARIAFKDTLYPMPQETPVFLGTIVQRFNIRKGQPTRANQQAISQISHAVESELFTNLQRLSMTLSSKSYPEDYCLAEISDFSSLNALYQRHGTPVFALTDSQLDVGGEILAQYSVIRDRFRTVFSELADEVITMTKE